MTVLPVPTRHPRPLFVLLAWTATLVLALAGATAEGRQGKLNVLRIGTSGHFSAHAKDTKKEEGALQSLKAFIKEETGLDNEILRQKDWRELLTKMSKGELELGVFQ